MTQLASTLHQLCKNNGASMAVAALFMASICSGMAEAATVSFTYEITADATAFGTPSIATPFLPTTVIGSGSFVPFGSAMYSEAGTITYRMLPSGAFVPASVMNTFIASFNAGANTFRGTQAVLFGAPNQMGLPTFSSTLTILSGTGIFNGATGLATATGVANPPSGVEMAGQVTPLLSAGTGQITAPGLNAVPEPGTYGLVGLALGAA